MQSREWRLARRPVGMPVMADFELATVDLPAPAEGEIRVANRFLSVDPYMRGRMIDRPSYAPPFRLGEAMQGGAIGEVIESRAEGFAPGDLVSSLWGWREAWVAPAAGVRRINPPSGIAPQAYLGVLGLTGLTAWSGLTQLGSPKAGETLFVSGGAGAVGSMVAQIGRILDLEVIASAGSAAKCDWLRTLGVQAINYRDGDITRQLLAAAPKGIDIYFDNVGGDHLQAALEAARPFARFVECGMIAHYNDSAPQPGPSNLMYVVGKQIRMEGFIVSRFAALEDEFTATMTGWLTKGLIRHEETIVDGLAQAPEAFLGLFCGGNLGKMIVRV